MLVGAVSKKFDAELRDNYLNMYILTINNLIAINKFSWFLHRLIVIYSPVYLLVAHIYLPMFFNA